MKSPPNNSTILSFSHVQYGTRYYVNQYGQQSSHIPVNPTVRAQYVLAINLAYHHPDYPGESEYHRAERLQLLDIWREVVTFQLSANYTITYTGERAATIWKAWNAYIFSIQQSSNSKKK